MMSIFSVNSQSVFGTICVRDSQLFMQTFLTALSSNPELSPSSWESMLMTPCGRKISTLMPVYFVITGKILTLQLIWVMFHNQQLLQRTEQSRAAFPKSTQSLSRPQRPLVQLVYGKTQTHNAFGSQDFLCEYKINTSLRNLLPV